MRNNRIVHLIGFTLIWTMALTASVTAEEPTPEGLAISTLEVAGNVTLSREEILSEVRARPGQLFNGQDVAEDVRRLARLDAVESSYYNAKVENDKVLLTYVVVEYNLVRSIVFNGNNKIKDSALKKELSFKKGDYLDIFAARSDVEALKQKYNKKGFPWAEITLSENGLQFGKVIYDIVEGSRPKVSKVTFVGNETYSKRKLLSTVKTRKKKLLLFPVYFDPDQLEKDTEKLLEIYQKNSFLDADVSSSVEFNEEKSKAFVKFTIKEGPAYIVDSIQIVGNKNITTEVLTSGMKLRQDYFYSEAWAEFDVKKFRSEYGKLGYIETNVDVQREFLPDARVKVVFNIQESKPYRIGEVVITGNTLFQDRTIRRVMDEEGFTPGQWYNSDIARGDGKGQLETNIKQRVTAESVSIQPMGDGPDSRDALVTVKEGQTGSIMVGAGIASDDGLIGQISLNQRNFDITDVPTSWGEMFSGKAFRGAGQEFQILASPGTEYSTYRISFTEPFLYDRPMSLSTSGSFYERERETYDEERLAAKLGLQRRYQNKWRRGISFRAENVKIDDLDWDAPQDVIDVKGDNFLLGARPYIGKNTTDNRFLPTRGYNFDVGYEQLTGDETFGLLEGTYRWYKTLWEDLNELKTVLETKAKFGTTIGSAPVFERYYLGGTGDWGLRGFEYRGVSKRGGPSNEPVGSDWAVIGNAEIAIPMGSETLSFLVFSDNGLIDDGGIRSSIGAGIQIKIPQFFGPVPMRFELAAPIVKDDQDETQEFSFSVGALF